MTHASCAWVNETRGYFSASTSNNPTCNSNKSAYACVQPNSMLILILHLMLILDAAVHVFCFFVVKLLISVFEYFRHCSALLNSRLKCIAIGMLPYFTPNVFGERACSADLSATQHNNTLWRICSHDSTFSFHQHTLELTSIYQHACCIATVSPFPSYILLLWEETMNH